MERQSCDAKSRNEIPLEHKLSWQYLTIFVTNLYL